MTSFGPAKRLQSERGDAPSRFRERAGQARPNLRHAGRDAQSHRAAGDDRNVGRRQADDLRGVAGGLQHARRARANVRFAERERPRHHQVCRLGFRQQTLAVDALSARGGGGAAARQTGQARAQPQDDVSDGRSSSPHPAARPARRHADGKLVSLQHDYVYHRSMLDDYHEDCGEATAFQYSVPNLRVKFGRARRNVGSPTDMRGPGAVPGLYATESAMNELADQLKIDPVRAPHPQRAKDRRG